MKTVRQLADALGVTKQAVHQKIKKPPLSSDLQPFMQTIDGVIHIDEQGETLVMQAFGNRPSIPVDAVDDKFDDKKTLAVDAQLVELLREQAADLRKQLDVKDKQIEALNTALLNAQDEAKAAQYLHAGTMHKQLTDGQTDAVEGQDEAPDKKPGLWDRLFKKGGQG